MKLAQQPPEERFSMTPLIDVAFLIIIFFMSLPLRQLDGKLAAYLPKEHGWHPRSAEPRDVVHLAIRKRGGGYRYSVGDQRADDPIRLEPALRKLGTDNTYEIKAGPSVEWDAVVKLVDLLAALRYPNVQFYGTPAPAADVRRSVPLPAPHE